MSYGSPSPFPPSFDGSPIAYAFGLFGDVVSAALSLALLLTFALELRYRRQVVHRITGFDRPPKFSFFYSAHDIYRIKNICLLLFIVLRSLPDALWMLAWGEVDEPTIRLLLAFDLVCDGLALIPLLMAMLCWAWARQVIEQCLVSAEVGRKGAIPWDVVIKNVRIVALVIVMAIGVTIGKASA